MLDQGRLLDLRDKTSSLNIMGSILLLVNNTIGAPIQGVSSFKKNLKEHLVVLLEPVHSNRYEFSTQSLRCFYSVNDFLNASVSR